MTAAEQALTPEGFAAVQAKLLEKRRETWPARSFAPSLIGHPCDRFIVFRFNRWEEEAPRDAVGLAIFEQGKDHQPIIYRRLEAMGFEIVRESDRPVQYRVGRAKISGRPDGRIVSFRGERYRPSKILEIKAVAGYTWDRLETVEDIRAATSHWTRGYYAQGQVYCFLENVPEGVFVFENKSTGILKVIPFALDFAYADQLLKRIERLSPQVEQGVEPEPIPYTPAICGSCGFRDLCYARKSFGEGASVITDPLLIEDLAERERLQPAAAEFKALDASIKDRLKLLGIEHAIAGEFIVQGKKRADGAVVYDISRIAA